MPDDSWRPDLGAKGRLDPLILRNVMTEWQRAARVVGDSLGQQLDEHYWQVGDIMLGVRLLALVESGLVEGRSDLISMRGSKVRLAS